MTPEERLLLEQKFIEMVFDKPMELEEIFGESDWNQISSPNQFGKDVKELVLNNQIENIRHYSIEGNNHNTYVKLNN